MTTPQANGHRAPVGGGAGRSLPPRQPKLRLEALEKRFGPVAAVAGVDLELGDGELVCLLGPSGCGKTTTLRMIGGLEQPTGGRILIGNRVVAGPGVLVPPEQRNLGMVFQSYALWPHMTVRENISYGLKLRGASAAEIAARVKTLLDFVEMPGYADRFPNELSGGQQQRVSVARSLATSPEIVLFDEPLSNLDATLRETMRFELRRIHDKSGLTGIYVTHSQEEAFALGDRIAVMNRGRIEQIAPPAELYERPRSEFVASFVGLANVWVGSVVSAEGSRARIRLHDGSEIVAATQVAPRGAVKVMVRPECILIEPAQTMGDGVNQSSGVVRDVVFSGAVADCFVQIGSRNVRAQLMGKRRPVVGDEVDISFAPEDAVVLDELPDLRGV
jgi:iron(III) transport system ATP-binding protein